MSNQIKIFDLVPVINKLNHFKSGQIESFCYSNTILLIGTSDGKLFRFSINKTNYSGESTGFNSTLIDSKTLNNKKPINQITVLFELTKIIYLSDGYLTSINFNDLEPCNTNQIRIRNVATYCYSKAASNAHPFGLDKNLLTVCIKGRSLQLYYIEENTTTLTLYKEIQLPELCFQIQSNKNHLCLACENGYLVVDIINSSIQKLFTYEIGTFSPYIVNHIEGEFLLNCAGGLGVFAAFDGQSNKPPLTWSTDCTRFQVASPYVLCASNESVQVFNLLDSKLKQKFNFSQTKEFEYIAEENFFIITTPVQMYFINMLSAANQIEQLLNNQQVDEAISLFEALNIDLNPSEFDEKLQKVKIKSAFIELTTNQNYSKAEALFGESNVDFRQIATLIPDLKNLFEFNDTEYEMYINRFKQDLEKNDVAEEVLRNVRVLLTNHMLNSKQTKCTEYVGVLFHLCGTCRPDKLADRDFLAELPLNFCLQNTEILFNLKRHHSIALVYHLLSKNDEAFAIWKDLCDGTLTDEYFPGFDFVIQQLSCLKDHKLLLSYLDWSMNKNQIKSVQIFTDRPENEPASEKLRPDLVIERLLNYKEALVLFLEYLVFDKSMKEKYTTQLIGIYLENVISYIKQPNETRDEHWSTDLENARKKLQNILQSSVNYRVQMILGRIKEFEKYLQKECAILYGKIEEHEKALKIFVYTLQDYTAATEYCLRNSKDSLKARKQLFHILFTVYMNPSYSERDKLLKPTLDLLNSKLIGYFDIPKLIDIIPHNWSLKLTSDFLMKSMQRNLSVLNRNSAREGMCAEFKFQLQMIAFDLKKEQLYIDEDSRCCKCHKRFETSVFTRQPNGKLSHVICRNDLLKL